MTETKKDVWVRLQGYHFDHLVPPSLFSHVAQVFGGRDASTRAFANKLTRKLGCTQRFALRAIAEYKKFVFLGVTSDFSVTPSKVIDQVWHEHLLFTQAYASFCREVLRTEFHHHPELVPTRDQTGVFQAQYLATLERYRAEFNAEPPADIWSVPKFKGEAVATDAFQPKKKPADSRSTSDGDDALLWMHADVSDSSDGGRHHGHHGHHDASPGAHHGHGHAGDDLGGAHHGSGHDGGGHDGGSHGDSGGSDGGGGGDGGSGGDGGGSGCSGGCGGGGD